MSETSWEQRLKNYQTALMTQTAENKRLQRELDQLTRDLQQERDDAEDLRSQRDERDRELQDLRPLRQEVARLQEELALRGDELDNRDQRIKRNEDDLKKLREQARQTANLLAERDQRLNELGAERDQLLLMVRQHDENKQRVDALAIEAFHALNLHYFAGRELPPKERLSANLQKTLQQIRDSMVPPVW